MTILRDSFRGINARFNLAGFYGLSRLFLYMMADVASRLRKDDIVGDLAVLLAMVLFVLTYCGVRGVVYQAAAGGRRTATLIGSSLAVFIPFAWVGLKVLVLVGVPYLAAWGIYSGSADPGTAPASLASGFALWTVPFFLLGTRIVALYAMPLGIVSWERRAPRAHIREGLRLFRLFPRESLRLVLILVVSGALEGALWIVRGQEAKDLSIDLPFALVLFITSYLQLVSFYGATRVVLARFASAPGPPA